MPIVYNGYIIEVTQIPFGFKIIEKLPTGRHKVRRVSACNKYTGRRDMFGNKLYTQFTSEQQVIERAKNFIDNHIQKWEDKKPVRL